MKRNTHKVSMSGQSTTVGVIIGTGIAFLISALLSAGLTSLVMNGRVGEEILGGFAFAIRMLSALFGGLIGTGFVKEKLLLTDGLITLCYLLVLLGVGIVVYDGSFVDFGLGIISVLIGGSVGYLIRLKLQNKSKRPARFNR